MISYLCRSSELHLPSPEESADGFVLLKEVLDPAKGWLENDSLVVELGVPSVGCRTGRISNKWGFIKMEDPQNHGFQLFQYWKWSKIGEFGGTSLGNLQMVTKHVARTGQNRFDPRWPLRCTMTVGVREAQETRAGEGSHPLVYGTHCSGKT